MCSTRSIAPTRRRRCARAMVSSAKGRRKE
jgi:hypothetical protein